MARKRGVRKPKPVRGRPPCTERPVKVQVTLFLYPSRHQGILDYLQAGDLPYAAKIVTAIHAALTGGVLTTAQTVAADEEALMFDAMEDMFS